ncbi:hypothetical protein KM031_22415 (plasmid) [Gemmobacter fulvus]|uniref:Uncharacterized protein n=1 Tax=Gemmobacter fulvus TaxID=2840474 RepID=A0A975PC53_9RHOB|nr:hypothetical protein [Gemmobacter fulvus]QWK93267.1 hypothetical protein KM031_22415 [Gemmobacter fulvus]
MLVEERQGSFRTLPPWMCDAAYCARMESGPPVVALEALRSLAQTLDLMRHGQLASSCGGSIPEEDTHALPTPTLSQQKQADAESALPGPERQPEPPPAAPATPAILEALADLLLMAAGKIAEGAGHDARKDHR